ncbi:MAG: hypothetical protein ACKN9J_04290 [Holophagaceae bacterium]
MYWILFILVCFWVVKNRRGIWQGLQSPEGHSNATCSFDSDTTKQQELDEIKAYFEAQIVPQPPQDGPHD